MYCLKTDIVTLMINYYFKNRWCVSEVLPCNPQETRRLDGTCNNLKHPNRGASHTPTYRLLPAHYDKGKL